MTKRVRVLKEMPFAKIGEEFEIDENSFQTWDFQRGILKAQDLVDYGIWKWVEEEKSLWEKLAESNLNGDDYKTQAQIAEAHYRSKFDAALESEMSSAQLLEDFSVIRKAMFGGRE